MKSRCFMLFLATTLSARILAVSVQRADGNNPAAKCLSAMADGSLSATGVAEAIRECSVDVSQRPVGCAKLREVLVAVSASGPSARQNVVAGVELVRQEASVGGHGGRTLTVLSTDLLPDTASEPATAEKPWWTYSAGGEWPTRRDMETLPKADGYGRLIAQLTPLLGEDRRERVRAALEVAATDDCKKILGGRVLDVCVELGPWRIRKASLWLAVWKLKSCRGDMQAIEDLLGGDQGTLEKAIQAGELSGDSELYPYVALLRRWLSRPPTTRWQAWSDSMLALQGEPAVIDSDAGRNVRMRP